MKYLCSLFIGLTLASQGIAADTLGDQSKPLKVFLLAGQSNMQGYGIISAGKDEDLDHAAANDFKYLKDADGNYLWQPPASAGQNAMLMGFPVREAEDMPDIASDSLSIAFGDFKRGYLVVDRAGVRVLRDPYSAKPYVLFYTTKRVGGGIQDFDAIKLIKFGVS